MRATQTTETGFAPDNSAVVRDLRLYRGRVWNVDQVVERLPFGPTEAPWNSGARVTDEAWLDQFVFMGFQAHGQAFLRALRGRFATAWMDDQRKRLFLARDWIGESPLHTLATTHGFYIANSIEAIRWAAGEEYSYKYIRAFPPAHFQEIDFDVVDPDCVAMTIRFVTPTLFLDFDQLVQEEFVEFPFPEEPSSYDFIRRGLANSIQDRLAGQDSKTQAILLSGGLDSFTIALTLKVLDIPFEAYTLSVSEAATDVSMAAEIASRLGVKHNVIRISSNEVIEAFEEALIASECYHLYNVYCAVGMFLLGRSLASAGIRSAFCGEAVNEALGDYTDWIAYDSRRSEEVVLQHVEHDRLRKSQVRTVLVWGYPSDIGKYNRQLGSGLAKHGISRMVKPFNTAGVTLECPYFQPRLLARMIAIPPETINKLGGKAGLVSLAFKPDLRNLKIPREFLDRCTKLRFQDASIGGQEGLTSVLLRAGFDHAKVVQLFNTHFAASLDTVIDVRRLAYTLC